jgi:FGGY-family pentulose kinase
MTTSPLFLGIDVGTQGVRAGLFDAAGRRHGLGTAPIATTFPRPAWAEQEVLPWWEAARQAVPLALAEAGATADRVAALGLDATACTVVACRADGTPLRPALLWMDQRAAAEAAAISATGDPILRWVSGVVSPEWLLPKALWLKRHEPAAYDAAERLVECTDWFMHRLTGRWTLSLNNVTVKWNYARPDGGFSPGLLRAVGLDDLTAKWPAEVVPLAAGSGRLTAAAAADLGLKAGTPVAQGGIDAYLGMLGLGAAAPGAVALILGSSTCHLAMAPGPLLGSGMLGCFPDAVGEGLYTLEGGQTATGSILHWYAQHFAGTEAREAAAAGRTVYEVLDAKAAAVPAGCDGLVCLDDFQGNRTPRKDPASRGAFWGLTLAHGPGHLFRSILEGTAFGTRHVLDDLAHHGLRATGLYAGGGGARSRLWLQIHADVCGLPVHVPRETEACALGAAMAAAVHAGRFAAFNDAAQAMVAWAAVLEPPPERSAYEEAYRRYLALYPALKAVGGPPR